jgi:DNA-binding transcriptional regulator YiaG
LPFSTWEAKIPKLRIQPNPRAKYKVGEQIKRKRVELGMTEDDIAALLGVEAQTIHAWEFGTRVPLPKQTSKLIGFLGYDPYEVI